MTASIMTFYALAQSAKHETLVCHDPACRHNTPVQEMYAVPYLGHKVSVTQDGNEYNVMIDGDPLSVRKRLSWDEVEDYVNRRCRNK